jgi:two-component system chemotaxis response regulator CheB
VIPPQLPLSQPILADIYPQKQKWAYHNHKGVGSDVENKSLRQIEVVMVGASAGGVDALKQFISTLPKDFRLPVLIVLHFPERARSMLPGILHRASGRECRHAYNGEMIEADVVYVAPPGLHMTVHEGMLRLTKGPKENGHRPAIDALFRSAAVCYGSKAAGVLLSGTLYDGTIGMAVLKRHHGWTLVQDPQEAAFSDMAQSAIDQGFVEEVAPISQLVKIISEAAVANPASSICEDDAKDPVEMTSDELHEMENGSAASVYTCPECHGTLFETKEAGVVHFRCRVGHAYSPEKLLDEQNVKLEAALWVALRALRENNDLLERLAKRARQSERSRSAEYFEEKKAFNDTQITLLEEALSSEIIAATNGAR